MDNDYNYNPYQYGEIIDVEEKKDTPEEACVVEPTEEVQEVSQDLQVETPEIQEEPQQEEPSQEPTEEPKPTYNYEPEVPKEEKREEKKTKTGKKWFLCVLMAVVFGVIASGVFQTSNHLIEMFFGEEEEPKQTVESTQITTNADTDRELPDVAQVAANAMPSVVSITNLTVQEVQNFFFGGTTVQEYESTGSGIIVGQNDAELLIVSNNHVVEGSSSLTVSFMDGKSVEAQIKGTDSDIDLAIIAVPLASIENDTMDAIKVATLGDSDSLVVGEPTIAIGNALGYGQSVTTGIVSALNRQIDGVEASLIQTDAAINPGNSGGALLNSNGEVIGINTAKMSADAVEGMGYAIPISDVNDIINELMNRETKIKVAEKDRGALGISGVTVDENTSRLYNMPQGVHVSELVEGGAAENAGIPKGCIIIKIDKTKVKTMEDLVEQLEYYKAGESIQITAKVSSENGDYVEKTYDVTLSKRSILD